MEKGQSTEILIRESIHGNVIAFQTLYDRFSDDLFRFIRVRVATRDDAHDILQEVFLDLWKAFEKSGFIYSSDGEFMGFLFVIARRKLAKLYRFRPLTVSLDEMDNDPSNTDESLAGEIAVLFQALGKLNKEDQELIKLRYYSGLSFPEIAKLLDKGESAVKVRHHRALAKLKELLGYEK
ncbi:MAG: sigma-70 family RNA polymerase sigma factor [Candidatus Zambryskibacteria bacterium]|nr:sigma-70 family RNA polymerase sigma factor [Candidatus Zambryskibacteria bacterium]